MNRVLRFAGWLATAFCLACGISGLFTPQLAVGIGFLLIAAIVCPLSGRFFDRIDYRASAAIRGALIVLILFGSSALAPSTPETVQSAPTPQATPAAKLDCLPAKGLLNAGMKLYLNSQCEKPFATLLGEEERDGERLIRIQFTTGEVELKKPDAVMTQAFISKTDPKFPKERVD